MPFMDNLGGWGGLTDGGFVIDDALTSLACSVKALAIAGLPPPNCEH